jgi:hypothetical protein
MPAKLGEFIQAEDAVVDPRQLARHRDLATADQARIRDGVMGGATRATRHQRGAVASEAGDTMDACGLNGFGQGHVQEEAGQAARQYRCARARTAEPQDIAARTPVGI